MSLLSIQTWPAVAMLIVGIGLIVAEFHLSAYGILGIAGLLIAFLGTESLVNPPGFFSVLPMTLILWIIGLGIVCLGVVATIAWQTHRKKLTLSSEVLIGSIAEVIEDMQNKGWAKVHGETWQIRSSLPLAKNQMVRVISRKGLTLEVSPVDADQHGE